MHGALEFGRELTATQRTRSSLTTPGVVNELRVRCVAVASRTYTGGMASQTLSLPDIWKDGWGTPSFTELRVLPAYVLFGRLSSDADRTWQPICAGQPYTGDKMEVLQTQCGILCSLVASRLFLLHFWLRW